MAFSECSNYMRYSPLIKFNLLILWQSLYCQCSIVKFQQRRNDKYVFIENNDCFMLLPICNEKYSIAVSYLYHSLDYIGVSMQQQILQIKTIIL